MTAEAAPGASTGASGDPLAGLGVADPGHRQFDAVFLEDRRQHGLEGVHLALLGMHRRDQLFHVTDAPLGLDQAELGGDLAKFQGLATVALLLGEVVLDHRAVFGGRAELGRDVDAGTAQPLTQSA